MGRPGVGGPGATLAAATSPPPPNPPHRGGGLSGSGPSGYSHAMVAHTDIVPDSERRGLIGALPAAWRPYASLIRLDRPIGAWLLFWPGAWSVALAGMGGDAREGTGW